MEQPCKGATREQLLDIFKDRVFYHLKICRCNYSIKPCVLCRDCEWYPEIPYIIEFDNEWELEPFSTVVRWDELFDCWENAHSQYRHLDKLYNKGFWKKPYVNHKILEKFKGEMVRIEKLINEELKDYPNFLGIDFCDVGAYGIQINGHHKDIKNSVFGTQPTIKYDFTNKNDVIKEFVEMWKRQDTPEEIMKYKSFINYGEEYGWD